MPQTKHLFLSVMNNSGSTLLSRYLERCKKLIPLLAGQEGQYFFKDGIGPHPIDVGVGRVWSENAQYFENPKNYNWPAIKKTWNLMWRNSKKYSKGYRVFLEKSVPNVLCTRLLESEFSNSHFIVMVRNPYAVCEGIHRRRQYEIDRCIKHWIFCTRKQMENISELKRCIWFTYEQFTEEPKNVREQIIKFIPEASDLKFNVKTAIHSLVGNKNKPLQNFNKAQIKRLSKKQIEVINKFLKKESKLLDFFGYELMDV